MQGVEQLGPTQLEPKSEGDEKETWLGRAKKHKRKAAAAFGVGAAIGAGGKYLYKRYKANTIKRFKVYHLLLQKAIEEINKERKKRRKGKELNLEDYDEKQPFLMRRTKFQISWQDDEGEEVKQDIQISGLFKKDKSGQFYFLDTKSKGFAHLEAALQSSGNDMTESEQMESPSAEQSMSAFIEGLQYTLTKDEKWVVERFFQKIQSREGEQ